MGGEVPGRVALFSLKKEGRGELLSPLPQFHQTEAFLSHLFNIHIPAQLYRPVTLGKTLLLKLNTCIEKRGKNQCSLSNLSRLRGELISDEDCSKVTEERFFEKCSSTS